MQLRVLTKTADKHYNGLLLKKVYCFVTSKHIVCVYVFEMLFVVLVEYKRYQAAKRFFSTLQQSLITYHRRRSRSGWSGFGRTTFIQGKNETSFLQKASNEQKC